MKYNHWYDALIVDVETLDPFDAPHLKGMPWDEQPPHMRLGLIGMANFDWDGTLCCQSFHNQEQMPWFWTNVSRAAYTVTWNGDAFDWVVIDQAIKAHIQQTRHDYYSWQKPVSFDMAGIIYRTTGRRHKLADVAWETVGETKTDDGFHVTEWLQQFVFEHDTQALQQAIAYNRRDLELTGKLFRHVAAGQPLLLPRKDKPGYEDRLKFWIDEDQTAYWEPY